MSATGAETIRVLLHHQGFGQEWLGLLEQESRLLQPTPHGPGPAPKAPPPSRS